VAVGRSESSAASASVPAASSAPAVPSHALASPLHAAPNAAITGPAEHAVVTVVLVDDSGVERRFLRAAMGVDPGLSVVGEARTGRDALALVERFRPSAVVLDLELPGMTSIEIIERIMASVPTPILVCSTEGDAERAAEALAAGAVDVVARPTSPDADRASYAEALRRGVRVAARVRVITHPRGRLKRRTGFVVTDRPAGATVDGVGADPASAARLEISEGTVDLIAIGASTGGPQALAHLLGALPLGFSTAIVVVQHMADGFIEGLASWLDGLCLLPVGVASAGARLQPGTVTIAPSARNLIVNPHLRITIEQPPVTQFHVPGVDSTFESVARSIGPRAIGVLLTGMGRDGALGLKAMRDAGAITIGQDEESSAVWGMPAAAAACGAVQRQLTLLEIAPALIAILCGDSFGGDR
jgi:two-component system, chemotaxis family, protein-glutamate methylesterase/glutaminase